MKKLLSILSSLLLVTTSSYGLVGCFNHYKDLLEDKKYSDKGNDDINIFNKIMIEIKNKFKTWWDAKALININEYKRDQGAKFNEFVTTLKSDDPKTFTGVEISTWSFLAQLINDFKKEVNTINKDIADEYNNFYSDLVLPITLTDDNITFQINKVNVDKIAKLIVKNQTDLNAITIKFNFTYEIRFKEIWQFNNNNGLIIISNNLINLNNVQQKLEQWFIEFIDKLFSAKNYKIIHISDNNFNEINIDNTIWPIIQHELDKEKILFSGRPAFSHFFNTINLWSEFLKSSSMLEWVGEGYNPKEITSEKFLNLYKKKNELFSEGNYYIKANIEHFLGTNLVIENLPIKYKGINWKKLKKPIKVLVAKDKIDEQLQEFVKRTVALWHYYKLETYNDKVIFNMKQADFDILVEKNNLLKSNSSVDEKISQIFNTIFKIFDNENSLLTTSKFRTKIYHYNNRKDEKGIIPKFKIEKIVTDKILTIKLFRNHYSNGEYPTYYVNFAYNGFGYSFFFRPDDNETNYFADTEYQFVQTFEFKG